MLKKDAEKRPSVEELLVSPCLREDVTWALARARTIAPECGELPDLEGLLVRLPAIRVPAVTPIGTEGAEGGQDDAGEDDLRTPRAQRPFLPVSAPDGGVAPVAVQLGSAVDGPQAAGDGRESGAMPGSGRPGNSIPSSSGGSTSSATKGRGLLLLAGAAVNSAVGAGPSGAGSEGGPSPGMSGETGMHPGAASSGRQAAGVTPPSRAASSSLLPAVDESSPVSIPPALPQAAVTVGVGAAAGARVAVAGKRTRRGSFLEPTVSSSMMTNHAAAKHQHVVAVAARNARRQKAPPAADVPRRVPTAPGVVAGAPPVAINELGGTARGRRCTTGQLSEVGPPPALEGDLLPLQGEQVSLQVSLPEGKSISRASSGVPHVEDVGGEAAVLSQATKDGQTAATAATATTPAPGQQLAHLPLWRPTALTAARTASVQPARGRRRIEGAIGSGPGAGTRVGTAAAKPTYRDASKAAAAVRAASGVVALAPSPADIEDAGRSTRRPRRMQNDDERATDGGGAAPSGKPWGITAAPAQTASILPDRNKASAASGAASLAYRAPRALSARQKAPPLHPPLLSARASVPASAKGPEPVPESSTEPLPSSSSDGGTSALLLGARSNAIQGSDVQRPAWGAETNDLHHPELALPPQNAQSLGGGSGSLGGSPSWSSAASSGSKGGRGGRTSGSRLGEHLATGDALRPMAAALRDRIDMFDSPSSPPLLVSVVSRADGYGAQEATQPSAQHLFVNQLYQQAARTSPAATESNQASMVEVVGLVSANAASTGLRQASYPNIPTSSLDIIGPLPTISACEAEAVDLSPGFAGFGPGAALGADDGNRGTPSFPSSVLPQPFPTPLTAIVDTAATSAAGDPMSLASPTAAVSPILSGSIDSVKRTLDLSIDCPEMVALRATEPSAATRCSTSPSTSSNFSPAPMHVDPGSLIKWGQGGHPGQQDSPRGTTSFTNVMTEAERQNDNQQGIVTPMPQMPVGEFVEPEAEQEPLRARLLLLERIMGVAARLHAAGRWQELGNVLSSSAVGQQQRPGQNPISNLTHCSSSGTVSCLAVGDRVIVGSQRGMATVRYIGPCHWDDTEDVVGLELEEPDGTGAGIVDGVIYFKCRSMHGESNSLPVH